MHLVFIWLASVDQALDLNNIRSVLRRFKLHQLKSSGSNGCLGDWFIYQTECLHSQVKRYEHPTEFSFFKPLPEPAQSRPDHQRSKSHQQQRCEEGDDGNYGSTAVQDVPWSQLLGGACLGFPGTFVAESKFRSEREKATELIKARDEAKAFSRNIGGQADEGNGDNTTYKVNPEYIGTVFEDYIMPLTKEVEVAYLLARLDETERPDPEKELWLLHVLTGRQACAMQESTAWFGTASGSGKLKKTLQEDLNIRADQL
ncbi:CM1 [Symbiodinium microadriaticum]|nr:CM1 [Symbiodinium microadriaticum]